MEYSYQKIVAICVALVVVVGVANGQKVCNMTMVGILACKPAATPPHPPAPSDACCSGLKHADIPCLCNYKNSTVLPLLGVDPKLAVELPQKCKLPRPQNC